MARINDRDPTKQYAWPLFGALAVFFWFLSNYVQRHSPPPTSADTMRQLCLGKFQAKFPSLTDANTYQTNAVLKKMFLGQSYTDFKVIRKADQRVMVVAHCSLEGRFRDDPTVTYWKIKTPLP